MRSRLRHGARRRPGGQEGESTHPVVLVLRASLVVLIVVGAACSHAQLRPPRRAIISHRRGHAGREDGQDVGLLGGGTGWRDATRTSRSSARRSSSSDDLRSKPEHRSAGGTQALPRQTLRAPQRTRQGLSLHHCHARAGPCRPFPAGVCVCHATPRHRSDRSGNARPRNARTCFFFQLPRVRPRRRACSYMPSTRDCFAIFRSNKVKGPGMLTLSVCNSWMYRSIYIYIECTLLAFSRK